jgi:hypothetical protein
MQVNVTSRAFRWGTAPLKVSAADEHTGADRDRLTPQLAARRAAIRHTSSIAAAGPEPDRHLRITLL